MLDHDAANKDTAAMGEGLVGPNEVQQNDSFNDVKSFITNQMGSIIRLANSERSILLNKVSPNAL